MSSHHRSRSPRPLIAMGLAGALLAGAMALTAAAQADTHTSFLEFSVDHPGLDTGGPDATIEGAATVKEPGVLDLYGRSVVTVADRPGLNPGAGDFSFGATLRLTRGSGEWNIMQKGYWGDIGQWKLSLHKKAKSLRFSCRFKGDKGAVMAYSAYGLVAENGPWVDVTCQRKGNVVTVLVGGIAAGTATGPIGTVAVTMPVLIGSKGMTVASNDQFLGQIDRAWVN